MKDPFDGTGYLNDGTGYVNAEIDHTARMLQRIGTNGLMWAQEYCKACGGSVSDALGWFCNAIEAGRDAGRKEVYDSWQEAENYFGE